MDMEVMKVNRKSLKRIYKFLELDLLEKFEYPCDNCKYFECEKNTLNTENIIRKRYKWNDIDWRRCLKREKEVLVELVNMLRLPEFREWSYDKCVICKKKFFKYDMKLHSEIEKEGSLFLDKKGYECKSFRLCKKCNFSYIHKKISLYRGFKKF